MRRVPLVDGSLKLTDQAAFWLFCALAVACAGVLLGGQAQFFSTQPGPWFLSLLLLAVVAIPVGVIVYRLDDFEPEPASLIAVAVIWGGVIAVVFSSQVNEGMLSFLQHVLPARTVDKWWSSLAAPINEELYKGMGLVVIYLMARREYDNVMDGLIYGAMIGLGFQVMENVYYFMQAAGQDGSVDAVVSIFFLRVVVSGLYSHMLFTGFMGFGFAYFVTQRNRSLWRRTSVLIGGAVLAWAAHFVWNSPWLESLMSRGTGAFIGALVIKGLPFLMLLMVLGVFARRRERAVFRRLAQLELGCDSLSQGDYYVLQSGRRRREAVAHMRKTKGREAASILKRMMREQINLALMHSRLETCGAAALEAQRNVIRVLKKELGSGSS